MKVQSIIKRDPPTRIVMDGVVYQFEVDSEGRHVVEVKDEEHFSRLLSIPEGYRVVMEKDEHKTGKSMAMHQQVDNKTVGENVEPIGSTVHPEEIDLGGGHIVSLDVAVEVAIKDNELTAVQWNALSEDERHALIDAALDGMASHLEGKGDEQGGEIDTVELDRDQLAAEYRERFGKAPHGKWSAEKILEALSKE